MVQLSTASQLMAFSALGMPPPKFSPHTLLTLLPAVLLGMADSISRISQIRGSLLCIPLGGSIPLLISRSTTYINSRILSISCSVIKFSFSRSKWYSCWLSDSSSCKIDTYGKCYAQWTFITFLPTPTFRSRTVSTLPRGRPVVFAGVSISFVNSDTPPPTPKYKTFAATRHKYL